jgi:hypothetical protein
MDTTRIKIIIIVAVALFLAIYLGMSAATAQMEAVGWVLAGLGVVFVLGLGKHVWILIPALVVLQGNINALPGTPPAWALAAAVVAGVYAIRFATRKHDFVFRWTLLDLAIFLQMVAVGQAWVRNPTGLLILGGATAGGKPYFMFAAAGLAYACLSVTRPSLKSFRWAVLAMVTLGILDGVVMVLSDYYPRFAMATLRIYGGNIGAALSGQVLDLEEARGGSGMAILGRNLLLALFCLIPTIRCINPFRIIPFTLTVAASVMSVLAGFRSNVAYFVVLFACAAIARKRFLDVVLAGGLGVLATMVVLGSGNVERLPFGAQRILTVLGVSVRSDVQRSADASSNDRFEVWKIVLTSKEFIRNKWLGDGFSVSAREQQAIIAMATKGVKSGMGLESFKEYCLATGSYHGFHVETIRFTGVLGLACAIFAMLAFFRRGLVLIRHFRDQPIFGYVLYICLPVMIYLFWSLLVFGGYRTDFIPFLIMGGMLKMLDNLRLSQLAEAGLVQKQVPLAHANPRASGAVRAAYAR